MSIRIEYVPLSQLVRWPRNPKLHAKEQLDGSIERFGFVQPLLVDESTKRLVAGHGRLEALQGMHAEGKTPPERIQVNGKEWLVPVVRGVSFKNEAEAEAYLLVDNRSVELGGWNEKELSESLETLRGMDIPSGVLGWDEKEITRMVSEFKGEEVRGHTPEESLEVFENATVKQIVFYFPSDEYDAIVEKLQKISVGVGLENNTEVFKHILLAYGDAGTSDKEV